MTVVENINTYYLTIKCEQRAIHKHVITKIYNISYKKQIADYSLVTIIISNSELKGIMNWESFTIFRSVKMAGNL